MFDFLKSLGGAFADPELLKRIARGQVSREELAFKLLPLFTLEVIRKYLRVEVEGIENVPKHGGGIIISNHSGYAGFDAMMLANEIRRAHQREARLVAHKLWFLGRPVQVVSEKMGLIEADTNACLRTLSRDELLILFPEGEAGNFKPTTRRYRLQEFKRGFTRLAMIAQVPIIPAFVIGAEETHINLSQIKFTKYLMGSVMPIPLNVIPLPVKWKIKFLPPVYLDAKPADAMNRQKVYHETKFFRRLMQREIIEELRRRDQSDFSNLSDIKVSEGDVPGI